DQARWAEEPPGGRRGGGERGDGSADAAEAQQPHCDDYAHQRCVELGCRQRGLRGITSRGSKVRSPQLRGSLSAYANNCRITIHSFGLGMTHKPDTMIELSTRTKASYTYVKDWMMLRECLAGCLGAMQSLSHQNVKLKL